MSIFNDLNTVILGVSVDDTESHKKFSNKYNLNFTLLSDNKKEVSKLYKTLSILGFSKRHTFLIDKNGVIKQIYRDVDIKEHSEETAEFIKRNML